MSVRGLPRLRIGPNRVCGVILIGVTFLGVFLSPVNAQNSDGSETGDSNQATSQPAEASADTELPWELRPYRVLISLAVAADSAMPPRFCRDLVETLHARAAGVLVPYCQVDVELNTWLLPARREQLARLTSEDLTAHYDDAEVDKVVLLTIEHAGDLIISGCEWDATLQDRGPIAQREVNDRRRTDAVALELALDLFRPLARVDRAEEGTVELRARAGELMAPESLSVMYHKGDLLVPYFRYLTREKELRSIQVVPWSYLRIADIVRSRMNASEESAFHAPLAGSRRRVELIAIRVRPTFSATRLFLSPRGSHGRPLVGVRVRVYEHLPTEEKPDPEMTELMTDRFGRIEIPASTGDPMRRLLVHSGGAVLGNVPFVPGLAPEVSLELPDDTPRLQAEGSLAIVQGALIDVVARRTLMLARALSLARNGNMEEAESLMREIDRQPTIASFKSQILAIRVPAVTAARKNRDASAEKRIATMCRDLEELVDRYLDRTAVQDVQAEIKELKRLSEKSARQTSS